MPPRTRGENGGTQHRPHSGIPLPPSQAVLGSGNTLCAEECHSDILEKAWLPLPATSFFLIQKGS